MREKTKSVLLMAQELEEKRLAACKSLFLNREILAPVLKTIILCYKNLTMGQIVGAIRESSIVEDKEISDYIQYQIHFEAVTKGESSYILLHLCQDINDTEKIIKTSIQEIAQVMSKRTNTNRGGYRSKIYLLWITSKADDKRKSCISEYNITRKELYGNDTESEDKYNIIEIITIKIGEDKNNIFEYLNGVLNGDMQVVQKYIDVVEEKKEQIENTEAERMKILGLKKGQAQMAQLFGEVLKDNRIEEMKKAIADEKLLQKLLREYGLLDPVEEA